MPKQVHDFNLVPSSSYPPSLFHSSLNYLHYKHNFAQTYSYNIYTRNYNYKMNQPFTANTECSSGCESGWTSYLENSYISSQSASENYNKVGKYVQDIQRIKGREEEEEEDLSMVSDASSGPPLFHQDEYNSNRNYNATAIVEPALLRKNARTEKRRKNQHPKIQKQSSLLDDTASSSVFDFSNNTVAAMKNAVGLRPNVQNFSQGNSSTQFQGTST